MNKLISIGGGIVLLVCLGIGYIELSEKLEIPVKMQEVVDFTETGDQNEVYEIEEYTLEDEIEGSRKFLKKMIGEPREYFISKLNLEIFVDEENSIYTATYLDSDQKIEFENLDKVIEFLDELKIKNNN